MSMPAAFGCRTSRRMRAKRQVRLDVARVNGNSVLEMLASFVEALGLIRFDAASQPCFSAEFPCRHLSIPSDFPSFDWPTFAEPSSDLLARYLRPSTLRRANEYEGYGTNFFVSLF